MSSRRPSRVFAFCAALILAVTFFAGLQRAFGQSLGQVTITFEVTLPTNTPPEDSIYVAGNFQNWDPGATRLTRDGGRATGSVTVAQGSAIEFKFTRGSWERVEKAGDCSELSNRMATADESKTLTAEVANWADICQPVYDPRAEKVTLESAALGVTKSFYVYTPPGYGQELSRRYPVLYLLRGHEKEWINKHEDASRNGRNVIDVYEELLAAGRIGPMILVFPGISSDNNAVSGMLTNFLRPDLTQAAGVGTGRFEDYFLRELIPYVDRRYRTVAVREGRGVDGFSLGGFMSVKIAAGHPELFHTVGAFDGTHFYADLTCRNVDTTRDTTFNNSMFDPVFNRPRDAAFAALNNGPNLVCNSAPEMMQSLHWFIQYGPITKEPLDANHLRGEHLIQKLAEKGVTNEIASVLDGGHKWAVADEHMRQTLPLHWSYLGSARMPLPDIVTTSLEVAQDKPGQTTLTATVVNTGSAEAGDVVVRFLNGQSVLGDGRTGSQLPPGASARVSITWSTRGANGVFVISAAADPDDSEPEENEGNNSLSRTVTFRGGQVVR
jgi:enterochelin esterase-like enzyme